MPEWARERWILIFVFDMIVFVHLYIWGLYRYCLFVLLVILFDNQCGEVEVDLLLFLIFLFWYGLLHCSSPISFRLKTIASDAEFVLGFLSSFPLVVISNDNSSNVLFDLESSEIWSPHIS